MHPHDSSIISYIERSLVADGPSRGGLRDSFFLNNNRFDFLYTETTGYAVTFFSNLVRAGKESYLPHAISAANFLVDRITGTGLPYTYALDGRSHDPRFFTFDNAICLSGLLDIYSITKEKKYLEAATTIGTWLKDMHSSADIFYSYIQEGNPERKHPGTNFADDGGCLHIKNTIGLLKLGQASGADEWNRLAKEILDAGIDRQQHNGAFPVQRQVQQIFSHAHSYATEGYLYAFFTLHDQRYLEVVKHAARYLRSVQAWDGGIFQYNRSGVRASDATAQAVRIWKTIDLISGTSEYTSAIHRALSFLGRMQYVGPNDVSGAILYTRSPFLRRAPLAYSWVGMFTASACALVREQAPAAHEIY